MFQAVYSDYAIIFGRYFPGASVHSNATAFTQMMAQVSRDCNVVLFFVKSFHEEKDPP